MKLSSSIKVKYKNNKAVKEREETFHVLVSLWTLFMLRCEICIFFKLSVFFLHSAGKGTGHN